MIHSRKLAALPLGGALLVGLSSSCSSNGPAPPPADKSAATDPASRPVEWVAFHIEVPLAAADLQALASGLFGPTAQSGKFVTGKEITTGIFLGATADPTTPEQTRVTLTFNDGTTTPRTMAVVPASFAVGNVFLTTIGAAIATAEADEEAAAGEQRHLPPPVPSHLDPGRHVLVRRALRLGRLHPRPGRELPDDEPDRRRIGTAASNAAPYDLVNGTVWFDLSQDDFDYFGHARLRRRPDRRSELQRLPARALHLAAPHRHAEARSEVRERRLPGRRGGRQPNAPGLSARVRPRRQASSRPWSIAT